VISHLRPVAVCAAIVASAPIGVAAQPAAPSQSQTPSPAQSRPAPRPPQPSVQAPQTRAPAPASDHGAASATVGQGALQVLDRGWRVTCQSPASDRNQLLCSVVFEAYRDSGQRLLAIELIRDAAGQRVLLTTPLGVNLIAPAEIVIDQTPPLFAPYQICQPGGCVAMAPVGVNAAALQRGKDLEVRFEIAGQKIGVPVPLAGLSAAIKRAQ
jgi:invasion protein IalB